MNISNNSLAILLLCSNILSFRSKETNSIKPFSLTQWNKLAHKIKSSPFGEPGNLFDKNVDELIQGLEVTPENAMKIHQLLKYAVPMAMELERFAGLGIWVVTRADKEYPYQLKHKLKEQSPSHFFGIGVIDNLTRSHIGVVGSRNVEEKGIKFTKRLVDRAISEGLSIVSGGAKGVDWTAQEQALMNGGNVSSVVHSDLEKLIRRKEIRQYVNQGHLTVISAVHPMSRFTAFNAMARNKYIYALSKATFVVSSSKKGGTWEGANENIKNEWVPLFVRDDDYVPEGNQMLLQTYKENPLVNPYHESSEHSIVALIKMAQENSLPLETRIEKSKDVYFLVKPFLKQVLKEEKTIEQLCDEFCVNREQMSLWITRASEDFNIKKTLF